MLLRRSCPVFPPSPSMSSGGREENFDGNDSPTQNDSDSSPEKGRHNQINNHNQQHNNHGNRNVSFESFAFGSGGKPMVMLGGDSMDSGGLAASIFLENEENESSFNQQQQAEEEENVGRLERTRSLTYSSPTAAAAASWASSNEETVQLPNRSRSLSFGSFAPLTVSLRDDNNGSAVAPVVQRSRSKSLSSVDPSPFDMSSITIDGDDLSDSLSSSSEVSHDPIPSIESPHSKVVIPIPSASSSSKISSPSTLSGMITRLASFAPRPASAWKSDSAVPTRTITRSKSEGGGLRLASSSNNNAASRTSAFVSPRGDIGETSSRKGFQWNPLHRSIASNRDLEEEDRRESLDDILARSKALGEEEEEIAASLTSSGIPGSAPLPKTEKRVAFMLDNNDHHQNHHKDDLPSVHVNHDDTFFRNMGDVTVIEKPALSQHSELIVADEQPWNGSLTITNNDLLNDMSADKEIAAMTSKVADTIQQDPDNNVVMLESSTNGSLRQAATRALGRSGQYKRGRWSAAAAVVGELNDQGSIDDTTKVIYYGDDDDTSSISDNRYQADTVIDEAGISTGIDDMKEQDDDEIITIPEPSVAPAVAPMAIDDGIGCIGRGFY